MQKRIVWKIMVHLYLLISLVGVAIAQDSYNFKNFSEAEKMSNNQVTDFFQDSYGFMWIATEDGLNRYDGRDVKIYKNVQGDSLSLPDNATMEVIEDSDKNIWAACFNAIAKLDRKTDNFKRYDLDHLQFKSPPTFYSSMLDDQGRIWFSTSELGVIRYDKFSDQFINIELGESNDRMMWGEVHAVKQLRNGLILAADVSDGIKSYNSATDKFDKYYLKPNFSPKKIYHIYEGNTGAVWFTGQSIFFKYSPIQYNVKEFNLLEYSKIDSRYDDYNGIVEDDKGNLWVGIYTHGIFKVDKQFNQIDQFINNPGNLHSLQNNKIEKMYKDKYGILWVSFFDGGIAQMDPNSNTFDLNSINLPNRNNSQTTIRSLKPSPINEDEFIIGTNSDGILVYNFNSKNVSILDTKDLSVKKDSNNIVNDLAVDYEGNIWYSMNSSQLKKYNLISKELELIESPHVGKTAQPYNIRSINVSPDNKIWISSNYGVDRYDPATKDFYSVPRIMNKRMSSELRDLIDQIRKDSQPLSSILNVGEAQNLEENLTITEDNNILLVNVGEGRAIGGMFDRGRIADSKGKSIWEMSDIYETFYDGGGFKNRIGVKALQLKKGSYQLSYYSDVGHSYKDWNTIVPDDSNYWGIEAYEINDDEYTSLTKFIERDLSNENYLPFEYGMTVQFSKTNSNIVWIGTNTNSFFQYDLLSNTYKQYNFDKNNLTNASHYIYCFYEDLDGIIWAGTYASFIRLNPKTGQLNSFTTADGIPGGNIYSITEDHNGSLWIHSSGGLSKLNKNAPIDNYYFVNYDLQDGLEGMTESLAVWKNDEGKIFLGGRGGIISFMPGNINTIEPDIVVYDFKIDDVSVFDDSSTFSLDESIENIEKIILPYYNNDISFEFASIHFARPSKNRISYQLEGFSSKWYESDRNYASFTNLDPGNYTYKVKGSNGDGIWNEKGRTISIVISPPWWQTIYAYISYALFFALSIFAVDRIQRRRLLSKAKERMKIQEAEHRAEAAELQAKLVQAENDRKTKEMEEARSLQLSMLPKNLPQLPHLDIAVYMKTATEVGGDYYDFHVGLDGTLTAVLGDATGHGMKAGTMVTAVKGLFNSYSSNPDILYSFQEINRCIKQMQLGKLSMCMTMVKINQNKLVMSAAGMPPILFYKKKDKTSSEEVFKGMPLGALENFPYEVRETDLSSGDTILLMSDGLPELQNEEGDQFGYQRVRNLFENSAESSPEQIIETLKFEGESWTDGNEPDDDLTFVVMKVK